VQVSLTAPGTDGKTAAGNTVKIRGTVKNLGTSTVHRVHAVLKSDNALFDENEMVFGKIGPGETKNYDLVVRVPRNSLTRTDVLRASVLAQGVLKANNAEMTLHVDGKPHPLFAYTYQTLDDVQGNQDGRVQRGEKVRLLVKVKNIGAGAALKTDAILRNGPGQEGILISAGRFEAKDLAPGATRNFSFVYEVGNEFRGEDYQLELMVGDTVLGESVTDKIKIMLATTTTAVEPSSGSVTVSRNDVPLREAPASDALVVGKASQGSGFKVSGKAGAFTRVELEAGRPAFIASSDIKAGSSGKLVFQPAWQVTPPVLTANAPTVVTGPNVRVKGLVTDDNQVKDLFIRVYNRDSKMPPKKVFYQPNRGDRTRMPFETEVPLWPGSNLIQVFARETNEVQTVATLVVLERQPPSLVQNVTGGAPPPPEAPTRGKGMEKPLLDRGRPSSSVGR
jgi:carboxyl-terminal processing protease